MKTLYLESVAGIAGDMFAASFIDAGLVDAAELEALPGLLKLDGVVVKISRPIKASVRTTHIQVEWTDESWKKRLTHSEKHAFTKVSANAAAHARLHSGDSSHWHTHYADLDRFLKESTLDENVKSFARKVFLLIAEAEADAHGMDVQEVSFHEVGAVDSILDVVMAAYCVTKVNVSRIVASPVKLGRGVVKIEHGTHPVPPPACARLAVGLEVAAMPEAITRENVELSTPTGLAILKALAPQFSQTLPQGRVIAQGMGAGTMDLGAYPNVFRVTLVEGVTPATLDFESDEVIEICCNIDDQTAERTAWVCEKILELGALDVWLTPITAKKGRAAVCLSILAKSENWQALADWLLRNSTTFGVRYRTWDRLKLARRFEKRMLDGKEVTFKVGLTVSGEKLKEKAEYKEIKKIWDLH